MPCAPASRVGSPAITLPVGVRVAVVDASGQQPVSDVKQYVYVLDLGGNP